MEETHVVTCFLRNDSDVLLFRRSDEVGSYTGQWGAVAGHVEPGEDDGKEDDAGGQSGGGRTRDPDAAARAEIREETGLAETVTLVRRGEPFPVEDTDLEKRWIVHPYLFDTAAREVTTNYETTEYEWVPPTQLLRRETVPELWTSYDRVRPTVATVADDSEHGSAYISIRALEVLRDEAALAVERDDGDWDALASLARDLLEARPSMTVVANRVDRVMHAASDGIEDEVEAKTPDAVETAAHETIAAARDANESAAARAADHVAGDRIVTLSRSATVRNTLAQADPASVLVAESRPGGEGVGVAESLTDAGVDVTLAPDSALTQLLADGDYDAVLVGADTVLPDGAVINKVGTRAVALAGAREGMPVYAVAASDKISPNATVDIERGDPASVYDGEDTIDVAVPLFDVTPPDLHDGVFTAEGQLDADAISSVAEAHAARRDWRS